jgi:hypothetical protein
MEIENLEWLMFARWGVGGVVAIFGLYVVGFNWVTLVCNWRLAKQGSDRHVSTVPLLGPLLLCVGVACAAWPPSKHILWCWVLDWPTVLLPLWIWYAWRSSRRS